MKKKKEEKPTLEELKALKEHLLSRRRFLISAGVTTLAGAFALSSCETLPASEAETQPTPQVMPSGQEPRQTYGPASQYPEVPGPSELPPAGVMAFFTPHEAATVEALTATILPGSPGDPGAREAGVVYYIDSALAYENGFTERTYYKPPFAMSYEGDSPPTSEDLPGLDIIWVPKDVFDRYGWQSILTPREIYRMGVIMVDNYAQQQHNAQFVDLTAQQQEDVVGAMADGKVADFGHLASHTFFEVLRNHTIEGMFSDPVYRGNIDMVGWKLVGYPGAMRAYTPLDLRTEGNQRGYQDLAQLHPVNPGQKTSPNAIVPVSGAGEPGNPQRDQYNLYPNLNNKMPGDQYPPYHPNQDQDHQP